MQNSRILVVDDLTDNRLILRAILEEEYQILEAKDGIEGLQLATQERPDLIFLDIMMPAMDGYEMLRRLRDRKVPTRVVMVSGVSTDARSIVQAIRAGACDFLAKPFDADEVINVTRRALVIESTLNFNVTDTTPIIEQLIAETERLEKSTKNLKLEKQQLFEKNEELIKQIQKRANTQFYILIVIRFLCLLVALAITILLFSLKIISSTQALFLPFGLFLLLLLPIERAKKFSIKLPKAEAGVEIDN